MFNRTPRKRRVNSVIDTVYPNNNFTEKPFFVRAATPTKTLIEKLILLHEEFKKPEENIKHIRMSRHFYDISKLIETKYFEAAKKDSALFKQICLHRKQYSPVKPIGIVNYANLDFENLEIIPPPQILRKYRDDYNEMRQNMIYGESKNFDDIIELIQNYL
ncbi:MAG: nucleotidyl transferase AbiEii/AbiGii toxin family protein [Melioribacteraceae bacterium]|nr:nucleotidyl transferase AbiEii/AbiGii toxin family protein [Melioribacteraceae bacterium]